MPGSVTTVLCVVSALLAVLCQIYLSPLVKVIGLFRTVQTFGLDAAACKYIPELQACEKIVLHQPSGLLYLACSTPESRLAWTPAMNQLNVQGRSNDDYVATYDPTTSKVTRLQLENFNSDQPISVHGMDVVQSTSSGNELFVFVINHRAPPAGQDPRKVGADSVIEVFKTTVSGDRLVHINTVRDPRVIVSPNDVVGEADGKGFFFTNDQGSEISKSYNLFSATTSVGYCHLDHGCKFVALGLYSSNGIVKASTNNTIYVSSNLGGKINVFERQSDNSLLLKDVNEKGQALDNISLDNRDQLWSSAFPKIRDNIENLSKDPHHLASVAAFKISANTGPGSLYGEKYNVEKVSTIKLTKYLQSILEDDEKIVSASTSIVHDSDRGLIFMHGIAAPHLTVCRMLALNQSQD
ncbi:serum paraoxonase/arylesterase [Lentinula edodes]|uniref:Serum paraoxonase/arylesterase n=1 Tax=Lentinula lateritia TaxID=40482 RepID=A0A9W8ZX72_9AGAR|nr:serum paraoxonase/arylesterase [Lentinula edodes]